MAKIPYLNYQLNFQSSHLTKKETEDASKRLSSYCMGALNYKKILRQWFYLYKNKFDNSVVIFMSRQFFFFIIMKFHNDRIRILVNFRIFKIIICEFRTFHDYENSI